LDAVRLTDLHKSFGEVTAVNGVDLTIRSGEVVALLGASGSGKSSLLRAVAGLEDVAAGEVAWDGRSMVRVPSRSEQVRRSHGSRRHREYGAQIARSRSCGPAVNTSGLECLTGR